VALTFDDGPHPEHTPAILDVLAASGAKATFFLQGSVAKRHPALVRAIDERGHQVGNHGWSHSRASDVGTKAFVREAADTQRLLEDTLGRRLPRIYRPPYGSLSPMAFLCLAGQGYRFVFWSVETDDSYLRDPDELVQRVEHALIRSGDILLFHEDYAHSLSALPRILENLDARRLAVVSVSDL
jgi:peptidoglycan/xylan/chitin deacetylase (PgdA/CDA1 family)